MTDQTPMARQYKDIKSQHQDAILFYRLGDFYEMFYKDAELASRELNLTLTGRGQDENRMPMCGVPYHAAQGYIAKLLEKGYKVAICEQVEEASAAKGLVKREVIKIYTPGTVIDPAYLPEKSNSYLLVVSYEKDKFGIAYVDASTGEFKVTEIDDENKVFDEINRINPSEVLFTDMWVKSLPPHFASRITRYKDKYDKDLAQDRLKKYLNVVSLQSFGIDDLSVGLSAAAAILDYLEETQKTSLGHINRITPYLAEEFMVIDPQTRRNLELTQTVKDKAFKGSLLWVLDHCQTNIGSRMLGQWLLMPLKSIVDINYRLDSIEELIANPILRAQISEKLMNVFDIERLTAKIASSGANARDIIALFSSIREIPGIKDLLKDSKSKLLKDINLLPNMDALIELINKSIVSDPPMTIKEGGIIKDGFNTELDELKKITRGGKTWIAELENSERIRTGIKSLKVGFNKVFGYYIEVTTSNLSQVPQDYIRKQTLTNCERYITPELKDKESQVLNADDRSKELEYELFCQIRFQAAQFTVDLQKISKMLAQLDVLNSLAEVASSNKYCRPVLSELYEIGVKASRHPVIEKTLGEHNFVPNNIEMNDENSFLLITGPNMAGKSTYMRQAALISIMAQIGSFVPALEAKLPIIDRIFTRIGAMDDIYSGQSTFMVEMTETANILNNATKDSLIILDEIGRGTATFDGMSIAAAVAEYIYSKIGAKTMFATHYHEITQLADKHPGMKNLNVLIKESGDQIIFIHKIVEGPADKSYGIQVAKLAGLPKEVTNRAKEIYETLEMVENDLSEVKTKQTIKHKQSKKAASQNQASLF